MPLKDGDVIDFDYELWVEGQERLQDTTLREAAEKAGIVEAEAYYAPMTYVLGSGRIIPGLEAALRNAETGATQTVELEAKDAYGERRPDLVETIPINEFKKNELEPQPGLQITRNNRRGVVTTVGGGRVRVDFNPGLAGKRLKYRFTVRKVASTDAEKVAGILRMHFPAPFEWPVRDEKSDKGKAVSVDVPQGALYHQNWVTAKMRALMDVRRFTDVDEVRFLEAYRLRAEEAPAEEKPAPA